MTLVFSDKKAAMMVCLFCMKVYKKRRKMGRKFGKGH